MSVPSLRSVSGAPRQVSVNLGFPEDFVGGYALLHLLRGSTKLI